MLGQNQIQKFKVTHPTKFIEVKNGVKIIKKEIAQFSRKSLGSHSPLHYFWLAFY
jgi:hypothetical protein